MRLFLAIPLPTAIQSRLAEVVNALAEARPTILRPSAFKWVRPQNLHITLKFLGEVDAAQVEAVAAACASVANVSSAFSLTVQAIGAHPPQGRARLIVGEMAGDGPAATRLAEELERSLEPLGFPRERRPFWPHVTLARARMPERIPPEARERWLQQTPLPTASFAVDAIQLVESQLHPTGPVYRTVERWPLRTSAGSV